MKMTRNLGLLVAIVLALAPSANAIGPECEQQPNGDWFCPETPQQQLHPAVVRVICDHGCSNQQPVGSGTLISPAGLVLTVAHATCPSGSIEVLFPNGNKLSARLVARDAAHDAALVRVEGSVRTDSMAIAATRPAVGTAVVWEGYAHGETPTRRTSQVLRYSGGNITVSGRAIGGCSGGPIYHGGGIVGVISNVPRFVGNSTTGPSVEWRVKPPPSGSPPPMTMVGSPPPKGG